MLKKIKKLFQNNSKFILGIFVGIILSTTTVYAANTIYSKNVTYDNSNSGLSATNVQDALDETYTKCFPPKATSKIINLYNDGSSINIVNIGGNTSNPQVKLNEKQSIMLDNNGDYRYYGADPNNYVTFNDETWRIIGVFHDVDDGTGKKETRLKIIRSEKIGNYSWDSSTNSVNYGYGVNDWSKSDLMTELNNLYYNSKSGTCYNGQNNASTTCNFTSTGLDEVARNMTDNAVYYLGGYTTTSIYADDFYNYERGTSVYDCSTNDGACPRATKWTGKIALIYPSDYAYATDLSLCTKNGSEYGDSTCRNNNWMNTGNQWSLMQYNSFRWGVIRPDGAGGIIHNTACNIDDVMPVLYLKSDVDITSGSGTSEDPYKLSLYLS